VDEGSLSRLLAAPGAAADHGVAALAAATAYARQAAAGSCAIILVEGLSDQSALVTLAARSGRNLVEDGVFVVPMGGATNIGHFLTRFGPEGFGARLAGLCDEAEEDAFRRGLERAGLGHGPTRDGLARLGFYVCVADLEDELIRSLGAGGPAAYPAGGQPGPRTGAWFRSRRRRPRPGGGS
jgi:hypothetical protein